MPTESQVILTNTAFFLQQQLDKVTQELEDTKDLCLELGNEIAAKQEEINKLRKELVRGTK